MIYIENEAGTGANGASGKGADAEFVARAYRLFSEFYEGTRRYRERCAENEEFWKGNHWHNAGKSGPGDPQPVTPVIFSTIESMMSDIMDKYPQAIIRAQRPEDDEAAADISAALEQIMEQRNYRKLYRDKCRQALIKGASVVEVYWDAEAKGSLGEVGFRAVDIKRFLWDTSCSEFQEGRGCFKFGFYTREWIEQRYPGKAKDIKRGWYVDSGDRLKYDIGGEGDAYADGELILVAEYWYKKQAGVHMARIAGDTLLYSSEQERSQGMYEHGLYPFVIEPLFRFEGEPVGFGMVDVFKPLQQHSDRLDQILMRNALASGRMKMFVSRASGIDEEALKNWENEMVYGNRVSDDAIRWIQPQPLPSYLYTYMTGKLELIKSESGQGEFIRGEAAKGVTAASAIMALQESGLKRSRMIIEQLQDGHIEIVRMALEVMCENYKETRMFRRTEGGVASVDSGRLSYAGDSANRMMDWDIKISVQPHNPFSVLQHNELMLQSMNIGALTPVQALELMIFDGKDRVLERARQNERESILRSAQQEQAAPATAGPVMEAADEGR
ncbi:MAG: hypothetical protein ACOYJD_08325 [Christensenellales bacterium]